MLLDSNNVARLRKFCQILIVLLGYNTLVFLDSNIVYRLHYCY